MGCWKWSRACGGNVAYGLAIVCPEIGAPALRHGGPEKPVAAKVAPMPFFGQPTHSTNGRC